MKNYSEEEKQIIEAIIMYLSHQQNYLKYVVQTLTQQKDELFLKEDRVFHEDIQKQYISNAKFLISETIATDLKIPVDQVLPIVESLNLEVYLK